MMGDDYTLLLRLEGPMQSWGYRSRFDDRDTALEPTRSGVTGLICAAMGIARDEKISQFDQIRMGVRVDREGRPERDYHTALDVIKAHGSGTDTVVSHRDYLADASFTVGLESRDRELLLEIAEALRAPKWPLYLGRRAFPLTLPPIPPGEAILSGSLDEHLLAGRLPTQHDDIPLSVTALAKNTPPPAGRRVVLEARDGERTQHDWPLSFGERRFGPRSMIVRFHKQGE